MEQEKKWKTKYAALGIFIGLVLGWQLLANQGVESADAKKIMETADSGEIVTLAMAQRENQDQSEEAITTSEEELIEEPAPMADEPAPTFDEAAPAADETAPTDLEDIQPMGEEVTEPYVEDMDENSNQPFGGSDTMPAETDAPEDLSPQSTNALDANRAYME